MKQIKVLVIDQDTPTISNLNNRLQALGHEILAVFRFINQVKEKIWEDLPQIIFINAPSGWGDKIFQTIEELNIYGVPVIVALNQKDRNFFERLPNPPPCDLVTKPIIDEEVQATIKFAIYRQQTQKEILEQEQQIQAILHSTGDGLITFDKDSKILHMNTIAETQTGWQQKNAFGQDISDVLKIVNRDDQSVVEIADLMNKRLETGPFSEFDITLINNEGNSIPVRANVSPIRNHMGHIEGGVIAFGNVSELARAVEQIRLHSHRADVLLDIIAKLNSKLDLDEVLSALLQETVSITEADGAVVVLLDKDGETYQVVATHSVNDHLHKYKGLKFKLAEFGQSHLLDSQHPIQVFFDMQDPALNPYQDLIVKENISSLALAELQSENQVLGAIFILCMGKTRIYSKDEQLFLKGLADQASLAIMNARLFDNVRNSRFRLQYLSKRLVEVQEAERRSMARELHDQIGQMLTGLQFSLESGKRKAPEETRAIFNDAQEIVSDLINQVRELSLKLLPSMLEDIGLLPTLEWHFEQFTGQTGIQVDFSHVGIENRRLPQNIEITAYRIIQEGLTNTARHAQVEKVFINIVVDDKVIHIQICDRGKGFDPERTVVSQKSFGLIGMRERTMLAGGKFNIVSSPGQGTQLAIHLPLGTHIERRKYER